MAETYINPGNVILSTVEAIHKRVFKWPCPKRKAHGPHPLCEHEPNDPEACESAMCPGVKAHPATQIGGSYDEW